MMGQEEQVLVVERRVVEQAGMFQGLTFEVDRYLPRLLAPGVPRFMVRSEAETNPAFKQLIPYVIISCDGKILSYVRGKRAGETRLVGLRSIGVGGHINPTDEKMPLFDVDFREVYRTAVQREVAEEVTIEGRHRDSVVALINDDSTEVGKVHLGIVHHWRLDAPLVQKREQMMTQLAFMTPAELQNVRDSLETWSRYCLDGLGEKLQITNYELQREPG
jgi:predicted NUDIX family phosphoesterase